MAISRPRLRRSRLLFALVPILAAGGCSPPAPEIQVPDVIVEDSLGVQIVENHAPVWDTVEHWTVDPEPEFILGGHSATANDSSHLVWQIIAAAPLSDGRVVLLAPSGDRKVLVFERSGALSTSFVRAGEGPGEHDYPLHLQVLPGDTIVLWGQGFGRISHYDPAGNLLQERRIDARSVIDAMRTSDEAPGESVYLPLPDGSFLLRLSRPNWRRPTTAGTIFRHPRGYVRIDSAYSVHSFGWWGGEEELATEGGYWYMLPFQANSIAVGADTPPQVYITNADRHEVHQFSANGVLKRIFRRFVDSIPITDGEIEDYIDRLLSLNGWDRVAVPEFPRRDHPAIYHLLVDAEGNLWTQDTWDMQRQLSEWSIFNPQGRWLGTLAVPAEFVHWIGNDLLLASNYDHDIGVETVVGYRLNRPRRVPGNDS